MEMAKIRVEINEEKEQRVENTNKSKNCSIKKIYKIDKLHTERIMKKKWGRTQIASIWNESVSITRNSTQTLSA